MKHAKAIGIKFIIITVVLYSILPLFPDAGFFEILLTSILLTVTSYIIGDLFVLRYFGNLTAAIADLGLISASLWILNAIFIGVSLEVTIATLFAATFITLGEALFHMFLKERVFPKQNDNSARDRTTSYSTGRLQTEFAEENDIQNMKKK